MKLNIYINRLVRDVEKKIGKKETMKEIGVNRTTIFRWKKNYYELSTDNLEHVCRKYVEIFPKTDLKEILMQGLIYWLEDRLEDKV
jgi:DNA-binding Xre family transcriptional regulator